MPVALASLFLFFLLLFPSQINSNPVLISKTLVWGSKLIRVSLPFSVNRLKSIYTSWKNSGRPFFSRLKIPFTTAVAYIGVSWLLNEFERLYQEEQSSVSPFQTDVSADVCINYLSFSETTVSYDSSVSFLIPVSISYQNGAISVVEQLKTVSSGQTVTWCINLSANIQINSAVRALNYPRASTSFCSFLQSLPPCPSTARFDPPGVPSPFDLVSELSKSLPSLVSSPIEAYPTADDPAYTDAFPIPTSAGDEVSIVDTATGETQTETGSGDQDTGQVAFPDDNSYDPSVDVPEKLSIPSLLQSFISNSPLLRWVQGANVQASPGSCSVTGSWSLFGQIHSFTLDFCSLQPYLNTIGSFILAFAHLYALYIIFRVS